MILFRFIIPISWYNLLFIELYFATTRPFVVKNIFSAQFFTELGKTKPSGIYLAVYFMFFTNMFWTLSFSIFLLIWLICILSSLSKPSYQNEIDHFHFCFSLSTYSCQLKIMHFLVSCHNFFPLTFAIWRFSSLFFNVCYILKLIWLVGDIMAALSVFFFECNLLSNR